MRTLNEHLSEEIRTSFLRYDPAHRPEISTVFPAQGPLEVEIGCGKGKFLIARAAENPWINFLGIDVVWKWMRYAVHRSDRQQIRNVKFIRTEANDFILHSLPAGGVSTFHVYFPDPWPKRKHRKRRLVTGQFLKLLHSRLEDGGLIELATDHEDYFLQMEEAVVRSAISWKCVRRTAGERLFEAQTRTNYELKYAAAGRTLQYLELQK